LKFRAPSSVALCIVLKPPDSSLYLAPSREANRALPPDPFTTLLLRELEGATLVQLRRPSLDRVVEVTWAKPSVGSETLAVELLGKSANLLLLDSQRRVLGYAREMSSSFRAPVEGKPYLPPLPRKGWEAVTLDPTRVPEYLERFADVGPPPSAAAAFLRGLSPCLADD